MIDQLAGKLDEGTLLSFGMSVASTLGAKLGTKGLSVGRKDNLAVGKSRKSMLLHSLTIQGDKAWSRPSWECLGIVSVLLLTIADVGKDDIHCRCRKWDGGSHDLTGASDATL